MLEGPACLLRGRAWPGERDRRVMRGAAQHAPIHPDEQQHAGNCRRGQRPVRLKGGLARPQNATPRSPLPAQGVACCCHGQQAEDDHHGHVALRQLQHRRQPPRGRANGGRGRRARHPSVGYGWGGAAPGRSLGGRCCDAQQLIQLSSRGSTLGNAVSRRVQIQSKKCKYASWEKYFGERSAPSCSLRLAPPLPAPWRSHVRGPEA